MVLSAKRNLQEDQGIKYFLSEDVSNEGRALKSELKRIAQVANQQGKTAKVTGNKVTINSRPYFSNELSMIPPDVTEGLKHEKEIEGGIVYKGERSILSNSFPSPFTYNGIEYCHVEQYFQHCKATHHNDHQAAERIMRLSNPRRIKSVGDGIEAKQTWLEGRMMTLYHGVKAKFDQNWSLHDELIATKGKQLYEGTTDPYFACGLGYESTKWADHDWSGENVAGLILMKIRDELLNQLPAAQVSEGTTDETTSRESLESSMNVDTQSQPLDDSAADADVSTSTVIDKPLSEAPPTGGPSDQKEDVPINTSSTNTDSSVNILSHGYQPPQRGRKSNRRGRGKGRGRGGRPHQSQQMASSRRPQDSLTDSDRSFLCGVEALKKHKMNQHSTSNSA